MAYEAHLWEVIRGLREHEFCIAAFHEAEDAELVANALNAYLGSKTDQPPATFETREVGCSRDPGTPGRKPAITYSEGLETSSLKETRGRRSIVRFDTPLGRP